MVKVMDEDEKRIKGTKDNDYINPDGFGYIETGKGNDIVVISQGDFFEINGLSGTDLPFQSKNKVKEINAVRNIVGKAELDVGQNDILLSLIHI